MITFIFSLFMIPANAQLDAGEYDLMNNVIAQCLESLDHDVGRFKLVQYSDDRTRTWEGADRTGRNYSEIAFKSKDPNGTPLLLMFSNGRARIIPPSSFDGNKADFTDSADRHGNETPIKHYYKRSDGTYDNTLVTTLSHTETDVAFRPLTAKEALEEAGDAVLQRQEQQDKGFQNELKDVQPWIEAWYGPKEEDKKYGKERYVARGKEHLNEIKYYCDRSDLQANKNLKKAIDVEKKRMQTLILAVDPAATFDAVKAEAVK